MRTTGKEYVYERKTMVPRKNLNIQQKKVTRARTSIIFITGPTAIRNKGHVVEDALFGYRAAAPALLCNDSYFKQCNYAMGPGEPEQLDG